MTAQRTLEMDFATELNRTQRLRVNDALIDLSPAQISTVMDNIISKNIFNSNSGEFIGKLGARIVTRDVAEIELT
jgi:hypothetical protein